MISPNLDFDPIAILHNLNYLEDKLPPLPNVLTPHDVYWEDWEECLEVFLFFCFKPYFGY